MNNKIVSTEWLKNNLNNKDLILLDVSPKMTAAKVISEYADRMIPHSRILDLKGNFTDKSSKFPNTIPSQKQFEKECQKLGINKNSMIVVYDNFGIYASPRVWWLFKTMGHQNVAVLNGGLPEWINQGFETVKREVGNYVEGNFEANLQPSNVKFYKDVLGNISSKEALVVDARSSGRFNGTAEEPRKYLKSGCIANSINIPYQQVLENGKFKSEEELKNLFEEKVVTDQKLIFSCGSGMTACIVLLASELVNENETAVYDGSWTEWAELQGLVIK